MPAVPERPLSYGELKYAPKTKFYNFEPKRKMRTNKRKRGKLIDKHLFKQDYDNRQHLRQIMNDSYT
jgi:hypothetical protein